MFLEDISFDKLRFLEVLLRDNLICSVFFPQKQQV